MEYTYEMYVAELTALGITATEARRRTTSTFWNRSKKIKKPTEDTSKQLVGQSA